MHLAERIHHYGVRVSGLEAALAWYRATFDLTVEKRFILPEARLEIVKLISPTGVRLELLASLAGDAPASPATSPSAPGAKHLCFEVDDIEQAAEEMRRRGVAFVQEPRVVPESNEKNCWIADNEGNLIEFIEELGAA